MGESCACVDECVTEVNEYRITTCVCGSGEWVMCDL